MGIHLICYIDNQQNKKLNTILQGALVEHKFETSKWISIINATYLPKRNIDFLFDRYLLYGQSNVGTNPKLLTKNRISYPNKKTII